MLPGSTSNSESPVKFEELLYNAINKSKEDLPKVDLSEENGKINLVNQFFKNWFTHDDQAYLFLFKKNLKVTNIQFAELLALIRTHNRHKCKKGDVNVGNLIFMSVADFKDKVCDSLDTISKFSTRDTSKSYLITELYAPLLERLVVIDSFFGSCAVFIPPHLEIKLEKICAHSGYVHSCGRNIFTRKINKTNKEEFFKAISNYLGFKGSQGDSQKTFFTVYSHEDYTKYDRHKESVLRSGLDDVKVYVDKYWMGKERLVSVIREMERKFKDHLVIPPPGEYKQTHNEAQNINREKTLWLIVDHSIDETDYRNSGQERYYICYEQKYVNENPFHIFDDDKPAWIADITMPHTLTGAMINITKPWWDTSEIVRLADPFGGTATTWFEALKFADKKVICECSDKGEVENKNQLQMDDGKEGNPENLTGDIHPLLARDNLEIFSADCEKLNKLGIHLTLLEIVLTEFSNEIDSKHIVEHLEAKSNVDEKESQSVHKDWERIKIENILKIKNNEKSEKKEEWCYPYPEDDSEIRSTIVKILIAWREAYLLAYFDLIPQKEHEKYGSRCEWTQAIVDKLYAENNHLFVDDFQKLFYRILFYLSLRTIIRNTVILEKREGELLLEAKTELLSPEKRKKWRNAYAKELNVLISKLRELHKLRSREVNNNLDIQENSEENPLLMFLDKYSKSCSISSKFLEKKFKEFKTQPQIIKRDALKLKENEYDVIVTDPPYGLNIKEEIEELAKLYSEVIRVMIKSLKDDGQMVLGLPDRSHTGRELPFFTQEDFITRQIIAIADKEGFEVVNLLSEVPRPQEIFQTPYYWESERALRRAILHFRFRRKKTKTKESNL